MNKLFMRSVIQALYIIMMSQMGYRMGKQFHVWDTFREESMMKLDSDKLDKEDE